MSDKDNPKSPNPSAPQVPPERTSGKCPTCGRDLGLDQLAEIEAAKSGKAAPPRAPGAPPAPATSPPAR